MHGRLLQRFPVRNVIFVSPPSRGRHRHVLLWRRGDARERDKVATSAASAARPRPAGTPRPWRISADSQACHRRGPSARRAAALLETHAFVSDRLPHLLCPTPSAARRKGSWLSSARVCVHGDDDDDVRPGEQDGPRQRRPSASPSVMTHQHTATKRAAKKKKKGKRMKN